MPFCTCVKQSKKQKEPEFNCCHQKRPQINCNNDNSDLKKYQAYTKKQLVNRLKQYQDISQYLKGILDVTELIATIMRHTCIDQCKCMQAIDYIIYAFLHFDTKNKKKSIRKKDLTKDLIDRCVMTGAEAKITVDITDAFFKAFYYLQEIKYFKLGYINKCVWNISTGKIINYYKERECESNDVEEYTKKVVEAVREYLEDRKQQYINS